MRREKSSHKRILDYTYLLIAQNPHCWTHICRKRISVSFQPRFFNRTLLIILANALNTAFQPQLLYYLTANKTQQLLIKVVRAK